MYKIGEFSKITHLTVKTLRYYDEEKILTPSLRNEENGYRLYTNEDFKKAERIVMLRQLDFSIAEIKDVICACDTEEDLAYYLKEKQHQIETHIQKERALLRKIQACMPSEVNNRGETILPNYEVKVKTVAESWVATIRYRGKYNEMGKYIGIIYKAIKGKAKGIPFNCYYDDSYKEEADIEVCVPVEGMNNDLTGDAVTIKKMPEILALSVIHNGSYETLNLAYKAVLDYAKTHHMVCEVPFRELYIKGPGMIFKGNPKKYVTEILVPVSQSR